MKKEKFNRTPLNKTNFINSFLNSNLRPVEQNLCDCATQQLNIYLRELRYGHLVGLGTAFAFAFARFCRLCHAQLTEQLEQAGQTVLLPLTAPGLLQHS